MECGMERRFHRGFTAAEKTELWDRWKRGESLKAIGRAFWQAVLVDLFSGGSAWRDSSCGAASLQAGLDARGTRGDFQRCYGCVYRKLKPGRSDDEVRQGWVVNE